MGIYLYEEPIIEHHIDKKINKASKGVGFIHKLNNFPSCPASLTMYYGDVIYEQPGNDVLSSKIETSFERDL